MTFSRSLSVPRRARDYSAADHVPAKSATIHPVTFAISRKWHLHDGNHLNEAAEVDMAGRYEGSPARWRRDRGPRARRASWTAARSGPDGRPRWRWGRRRRRRRAVGCLLWLATLLLVLLVLSLLFGGFRRGSGTGDGPAHAVPSALSQAAARSPGPEALLIAARD
jgi:hypothetical protein